MIDKIFEMLIEEAKTREGHVFAWKLFSVIQELDAKIIDYMMELDDRFMDDLPDDPEELAWNSPKAYREEVKRRHDRRNL